MNFLRQTFQEQSKSKIMFHLSQKKNFYKFMYSWYIETPWRLEEVWFHLRDLEQYLRNIDSEVFIWQWRGSGQEEERPDWCEVDCS